MTSQLQQVINLAQSLSFTEQLELLKTLSTIIQQSHSLETQSFLEENNTEFSVESFRKSWRQAVAGETLPFLNFGRALTLTDDSPLVGIQLTPEFQKTATVKRGKVVAIVSFTGLYPIN